MTRILLAFLLICIFISCDKSEVKEDVIVEGMKPIYTSLQDIVFAESQPARSFGNLGKLVSAGNFIMINEQFEGIHVVDNSNPRDPSNLYFWKITGNINFTLKGKYLYADNTRDLLTIDISDPADIKLISRIKDVHPEFELALPDQFSGFFECVEYSKGIVTGWEETTLTNPKCRR